MAQKKRGGAAEGPVGRALVVQRKAPVDKAAKTAAVAGAKGSAITPSVAAAKGKNRRLKTQASDQSVAGFLAQVADPGIREDCQALNQLLSAITGMPPRLWGSSMVGFGQYHYRYASGTEGDWPLCAYSPRKQNLTVYVMAGFDPFPQLMRRLGRYKTGKSCLYVRRLSDLNMEVLRELVVASNAWLRQTYG